MSNIKDISDGGLNRLQNQVTDLMLDYRTFCMEQAPLYKKVIPLEETVKFTYTLLYITNVLSSSLAKLYMLFGYTKGEIDIAELNTIIHDIDTTKMSDDRTNMYVYHGTLTNYVTKAEDLYTRINHISQGHKHG